MSSESDDCDLVYAKVELIQRAFDILDAELSQVLEYLESRNQDLSYERNSKASARVTYKLYRGSEPSKQFLGKYELRKIGSDVTELTTHHWFTGNPDSLFDEIQDNFTGMIKYDQKVTKNVIKKKKSVVQVNNTRGSIVRKPRIAPKRPSDFNRWKLFWHKVQPVSGLSIPDIMKYITREAKFSSVHKYSSSTVRKIIAAGLNNEFDEKT